MQIFNFFLQTIKKYYLSHWAWIGFLLCIGSRLITTIYYIEDVDSLRFALAAKEFDVTKLQPHFPGYPVFCFFLKIFYWMLGRFSIAFSLIGGVATFLIMFASREIVSEIYPDFRKWIMDILIFFNPFFWLMANRYMPDLLGLSATVCALYFLVKYLKYQHSKYLLFFYLMVGLITGVRLSFLPFLFVPAIFLFFSEKKKQLQLFFLLLGIMTWFIPFIIITGWNDLINAALKHTQGHFYYWGGTVLTEPDYLLRLKGIISGIIAHGMGGYWQGRHWSTLVVFAGVLIGILLFLKYKIEVFDGVIKHRKVLLILFIFSFATYLLWIFFYQNVIYNPRHCLLLIWVVLLIVALGFSLYSQKFKILSFLLFFYFAITYTYVTFHLVSQHKKPSAISQTLNYLKSKSYENLAIISTPMFNQYLKNQKLNARFYNIEDKNYLQKLISKENTFFIGYLPEEFTSKSYNKITFFHNPYVNTLWPQVDIFELNNGN